MIPLGDCPECVEIPCEERAKEEALAEGYEEGYRAGHLAGQREMRERAARHSEDEYCYTGEDCEEDNPCSHMRCTDGIRSLPLSDPDQDGGGA